MAHGAFDPTAAGASAWYDVDAYASTYPGMGAGWYDETLLEPPFVVIGEDVIVAAILFTSGPVVAVAEAIDISAIVLPATAVDAGAVAEPGEPAVAVLTPART
jgi:hypothetical protein